MIRCQKTTERQPSGSRTESGRTSACRRAISFSVSLSAAVSTPCSATIFSYLREKKSAGRDSDGQHLMASKMADRPRIVTHSSRSASVFAVMRSFFSANKSLVRCSLSVAFQSCLFSC